jgi:hypothetical protein
LHVDSHIDSGIVEEGRLQGFEAVRSGAIRPGAAAAMTNINFAKVSRSEPVTLGTYLNISREIIWLKPPWETTQDATVQISAHTVRFRCGDPGTTSIDVETWERAHIWLYPLVDGEDGLRRAMELAQVFSTLPCPLSVA